MTYSCPRCDGSIIKNEYGIYACTNCKYQQLPQKQENPKPKSDKLGTAYHLIPYEGISAISKIFIEGLRYGRDNWKTDPDNIWYQEERCNHAIEHLLRWSNGDRSEPHLAKVGWFVVTQIWREEHKTKKEEPCHKDT